MPPRQSRQENIFQIKITLYGIRPPIWRRVEVPATMSLGKLHDVIQGAMGWHDIHLHSFVTPEGEEYSRSFEDVDLEAGVRDETRTPLRRVLPGVGTWIRYVYDYGDDWEHKILLEKILPANPPARYPRLTAGRRACPPEDCGGIDGYARSLSIRSGASSSSEDDESDDGWFPASFDSEEFDLLEANRRLTSWVPMRR